MTDRAAALTAAFLDDLSPHHPGCDAYLAAVASVARDVLTVEKAHPDFAAARVLARLAEPDRVIEFRVVWRDDAGSVQVNRGWRVQQSNLLGPYKGGLRWDGGVRLPVLRALAFEQVFKNALTGLPLGGAKGGADFDPSGRSVPEIERFARAFMQGLAPHIGPDRDVPAGDMGVGADEVGLMARAYATREARWTGALTGKPLCLGGSRLRAEATGYGLVHFLGAMLAAAGEALEGRRVAVSGRGNVAVHAAAKAMQEGARVISLSGRSGSFHAPDGLSPEALEWIAARGGDEPPSGSGLRFLPGTAPWELEPEIALPCATQGEIGAAEARALAEGGCRFLAEGANMPVTSEAVAILDRAGVVQAPGKAANAGGVVVSALEMTQNAGFERWEAERVDARLREVMCAIHRLLAEEAAGLGAGNGPDYRRAANLAAYRRLARAVVEGGVV